MALLLAVELRGRERRVAHDVGDDGRAPGPGCASAPRSRPASALAAGRAGERRAEVAEGVLDLQSALRVFVPMSIVLRRSGAPRPPCRTDRRPRRPASRTSTATFGRSRRSTTKSSRPLSSFAVFTSGARNGRSAPSAGSFERSSAASAAARPTSRDGSGRAGGCGVRASCATASWTSAAVDVAIARDVLLELAGIAEEACCTGSSRSALPPKPPIRSRPVTKSNSCFVLARVELGRRSVPSSRAGAISSVTIFSISASEAPGRAVAMTTNQPEISRRVLERLDRASRAACRRRAPC